MIRQALTDENLTMNNLVWFRNDLRVLDNPALKKSMALGPSIAIYCLCQNQWQQHGLAALQQRLIKDQLYVLEKQLARLNVPLIILDCGDFGKVPELIVAKAKQLNISKLFYNYLYEINEDLCAKRVVKSFVESVGSTHGYHDQCIIEPGKILNGNGECYKVFSAYCKKWVNDFSALARPLYKKPSPQSPVSIESDMTVVKNFSPVHYYDEKQLDHWPLGEENAHDRLAHFIEYDVSEYHNNRDFPDLDKTSHLSTYLAIGILSTRQCLQALIIQTQQDPSLFYSLLSEGERCWLNELVWREFYRHILVAFPNVGKGKPFKISTDQLPWKADQKAYEAWCQGQTGVPIVDAAMRQLNTTGWMHNRLRMVVAMFLTKHLMIDWRLGEAYFYSRLGDADFASNNGGWQWSASTGVDAVPYFRIFNPYRQAERFDPKGEFVRKYVKELAHIDGKKIHKPNQEMALKSGYPMPIVDLKLAAENTKGLFKSLMTAKG